MIIIVLGKKSVKFNVAYFAEVKVTLFIYIQSKFDKNLSCNYIIYQNATGLHIVTYETDAMLCSGRMDCQNRQH